MVAVTGKGPYPTYRYQKKSMWHLIESTKIKNQQNAKFFLEMFPGSCWVAFWIYFLWKKIGFTGIYIEIFGSKWWNVETSNCHHCNFDKVDLEEMSLLKLAVGLGLVVLFWNLNLEHFMWNLNPKYHRKSHQIVPGPFAVLNWYHFLSLFQPISKLRV